MSCHLLHSSDHASPLSPNREIPALCAFFHGPGSHGHAGHARAFPLEKSRQLPDSFSGLYQQEEQKRLELEMENLQKNLLETGMEEQLGENILESLQKNGIEVLYCEVHIEGELLKASVWTKEVPDEDLEGRIKDELGKEWGIRAENCEILSGEDGNQTVGDPSSSGIASDSDRTSGVR